MPRTFLYKKKRKSYSRPYLVDPEVNKSTDVSPLRPPYGQGDLINTSGKLDDVTKVPFKPQGDLSVTKTMAANETTKSSFQEHSEGDTMINGDDRNELSKIAFTDGYEEPSLRNSSSNMEEEIHRNWIRKEERDTEPDLIKIFGVHEKEFHLKYKNHKVKADDYTRYEVSPPKTKLRGYLESFNTETGDDGEDVIKVKNPWAEHTSPFLLRKHDDVIDQPKTLDFYAPDWRTTLDRKSPPSEKWMMPFQEKEAIAGPTKAERRFDANVLSSLYQSYFYSASYYNSLHLRAWRSAQQLRNRLTYPDSGDLKEPYSGNGTSHHLSSSVGYPAAPFSGMLHFPKEKSKSPSKNLNFQGGPLVGKGVARQPVPGVEYVKNNLNLELPARHGDVIGKELDPDSSLDNSYGAGTLLNGYISGSGTSGDIPVKKAVKSKGNLEDHSADAITGFKGSTLKAILTPPQPQSYRGGRRSTSGKPPQPRKYVCDVCGKAFSRSNTLVTHKRIHTGDKPFACELCGRAFRQPGNLTRHRLTHTTVKPYVCSQCGKAFNRASNLHTHMRTHTNYKPFVCQFCGKGFHQKIDMKIHSYTHTGEKPHKCKKCGRGFKQLTHLTYHMRTHSEVKMYTCNYCGKGFNQKGNLQAHIYRHTGKKDHVTKKKKAKVTGWWQVRINETL
ncbi:uncharacterized protein [Apostichopus japonicus]|uniref:uncharacterized protein isoform X2 n=1 Tax=Stichopus japonicus TaxID=307972 RepID=UPI003AB25A34